MLIHSKDVRKSNSLPQREWVDQKTIKINHLITMGIMILKKEMLLARPMPGGKMEVGGNRGHSQETVC